VALLRENFAAVLGVLPFEEEYFLRQGVNYVYVGSPHLDRMSKIKIEPNYLGLPLDRKIIAFLPGSRMTELKLILPVMEKIRKAVVAKEPHAVCVIPLAQGLEWTDVAAILGVDPGRTSHMSWSAAGFHWLSGASLELLKVANSAVVASGTATLECALAGTPMSVVYVMKDVSYQVAKRLVDLKWVSLVNLLMNEEVVKEHIQVIDPSAVADEVLTLSEDTIARRQMVQQFDRLSSGLRPGASDRAAHWILQDLRIRGARV
jgi:lipid-A-disaccharide synthase